jgi:hypothetical protein
MKTKSYFFPLLAMLVFPLVTPAQCSVEITSIQVSGLNVLVEADGVGNINEGYLWDWGDGSDSVRANPAGHTYASLGGYQVCVEYLDTVDPFQCVAYKCDSVYITSTNGVAFDEPMKAVMKTTPNPFNAAANISLSLSQDAHVTMTVYNAMGGVVEKLYDGEMGAGLHLVTWKPDNLAEGVYFVQVDAGGVLQTRKLVHSSVVR